MRYGKGSKSGKAAGMTTGKTPKAHSYKGTAGGIRGQRIGGGTIYQAKKGMRTK